MREFWIIDGYVVCIAEPLKNIKWGSVIHVREVGPIDYKKLCEELVEALEEIEFAWVNPSISDPCDKIAIEALTKYRDAVEKK